MIEQSSRPIRPSSSSELDDLQRRISLQRSKQHQLTRSFTARWQELCAMLNYPIKPIAQLPTRFILHIVVALIMPLAMLLSQLPPGTLLPAAQPVAPASDSDFVASAVPLALDHHANVGDAPLADEGEIPVPLSLVSRSDALAPVIVPATIAAERVYLRNGPGTEYDAIGRISADTPIQVIGRHGDWFEARQAGRSEVFWISGELLNIPEAAIYTLFEVQDSAIPAPPPPKIAMVRESGLILRDGPGTNYVPITTLQSDIKLDLIESYQDWFHVGIQDGSDGWVRRDFLNIEPSVVERLLVADTIPDPNPAMVGMISESLVNLRKGPDSRYAKVGSANAGTQISLIGKYKDWVQIKTPDGTKAWVFSDLINTTAHVVRRVPLSKDFPALPVEARRLRPGAGAGLAGIPASGDVAGYAVQFVGARYRWGATGPNAFDCSGLTSYVYRQFGVSLPRTAASQFNTSVGASVGSMDNLAPGDLVFFVNTGGKRGISHVAMYIGGGRIVHAMTPRYGVQVSNVYDSYWVRHYYGGIRVRR